MRRLLNFARFPVFSLLFPIYVLRKAVKNKRTVGPHKSHVKLNQAVI